MVKREYVQLCQTYKEGKYRINGWFASTKLDGMRAIWDGGISRGKLAKDVPWANVVKDARLIDEPISTGLWSRLGKVIHAPNWWLDKLPNICLDGELYLGNGRFQELTSIVKSFNGYSWHEVKFMIFDSPPIESIFADGSIDCRMGKVLYKRQITGAMDWIAKQNREMETVKVGKTFERVYDWLKIKGIENIVEQEQLPFGTEKCLVRVKEKFEEVLKDGFEGLVLRNHNSCWQPIRSHDCLKYKPYLDDEGVVVGYRWGERTELGSKLLGLMGSMIVDYGGVIFELSGFTEAEREMVGEGDEGFINPGNKVSDSWENKWFPRGTVVSFRYRELSRDGVPREGRYLRKRAD